MDWIPGYGIYHLFVKDNKRLLKTKGSYLITNAIYHGGYIGGLLVRLFLKR